MGTYALSNDSESLTFTDLVISNHYAIIILTALYIGFLVHVLYRMCCTADARTSVPWIPKVFVRLVFMSVLIRVVTFGALSLLIVSRKFSKVHSDVDSFFRILVTILFNFGDWATLSIYLMLLVIWIETLQLTRHHFFSTGRIRRTWLTVFVLANVLLYLFQMTLYGVAFLAPNHFTDPTYLSKVLFIVSASISAFLPCVLLVAWTIYFCLLAGFPYKSLVGKAMFKHIMYRVIFWTISREVWAIFVILVFYGNSLSSIGSSSTWSFTATLVVIFLVTELLPALITINNSTIQYMMALNEVDLISCTRTTTIAGILPDDYLKSTPLSVDDDYSYPSSFVNNEMSEPLLPVVHPTHATDVKELGRR